MKGSKGRYAWTAKVGEKGQIVIPKEARDLFNFKPGDTVLLLGDETQGVAIVKTEMYEELANMVFGTQDKEEKE